MFTKDFQKDDKKNHTIINGKINFHTHSSFCDGKNTPEELIHSAIEKGFSILGFSSHSIYPFAEKWHISPNEHYHYVEHIKQLMQKLLFRLQALNNRN